MNMGGLGINMWGVLLAGLSSMAIGFVYYMPNVLGDRWMKVAKVNAKKFEGDRPKVMPLLFLAALLTAFILAYFIHLYHYYYGVSWLGAGLLTSLIIWSLIAVNITIHNLLDQESMELLAITLGNRLLSIVAMGLILGLIHP